MECPTLRRLNQNPFVTFCNSRKWFSSLVKVNSVEPSFIYSAPEKSVSAGKNCITGVAQVQLISSKRHGHTANCVYKSRLKVKIYRIQRAGGQNNDSDPTVPSLSFGSPQSPHSSYLVLPLKSTMSV